MDQTILEQNVEPLGPLRPCQEKNGGVDGKVRGAVAKTKSTASSEQLDSILGRTGVAKKFYETGVFSNDKNVPQPWFSILVPF